MAFAWTNVGWAKDWSARARRIRGSRVLNKGEEKVRSDLDEKISDG